MNSIPLESAFPKRFLVRAACSSRSALWPYGLFCGADRTGSFPLKSGSSAIPQTRSSRSNLKTLESFVTFRWREGQHDCPVLPRARSSDITMSRIILGIAPPIKAAPEPS